MMTIPQSEIEFRNALIDAAELGARKALEMAGILSTTIRLTDANRLYGRRTVKRWIDEGLINPIKDGSATSAVRLERSEVDAAAKMANREKYYKSISI